MTTMTAPGNVLDRAGRGGRRWSAWTGTALAQEFEKVENIPKQEIPAGRFVSIAYGIIWLAVLAYVVVVAAGVKRVNQEIAELKRKSMRGPRASR